MSVCCKECTEIKIERLEMFISSLRAENEMLKEEITQWRGRVTALSLKEGRVTVANLIQAKDEENVNLKAELATHRWIPVEERLPESIAKKGYSEHVMVTDGVLIVEGWHVTTGGFNNPSGRPYWGSSYHLSPSGTITHWKPITLPE